MPKIIFQPLMITNPPVLIGRTFFYVGFQIRRDAWRYKGMPGGIIT